MAKKQTKVATRPRAGKMYARTADGGKVLLDTDMIEVHFTRGKMLAVDLRRFGGGGSIAILSGTIASGDKQDNCSLVVRPGAANVIYVSVNRPARKRKKKTR